MIFKNLTIESWNQFENVDIDFNSKLTIITGANGSGKSSLLRLLSKTISWGYTEVATPKQLGTKIGYNLRRARRKRTEAPSTVIGNITLNDESSLSINLPIESSQASYEIHLTPYVNLRGLNILSHRTPYSYKKITSIPVRPHTKLEAYNAFNESIRTRYFGNWTDTTPSSQMKTSIISLAFFGQGNDYVQSNEEAFNLFLGFIEILKILLPPTLGFENINVRDGEVILLTKSGDFLLDAVSGGIGAIFDLAWQIYMFEANQEEPFFVLIDEAENHLHASMQRELLPKLMLSFPNAQFIVTTHSPLMVNSVKDSSVYVLKYNKEGSVVSSLLDFENKAGNAAQILREVLGVPVTMPIWVEESLNQIINKFNGTELTSENYLLLKNDLAEIGLSDHLPQALGMMQGGTIE